MWQHELDPCCCRTLPYIHQKRRGGRIGNITSPVICLFFSLPTAKHNGWFPWCGYSIIRKTFWSFKQISQHHKYLSLAITADRTTKVTADEGLGLPIHFSDLWVRFWTSLQTMTGSRSIAINFLNIFKIFPGLRFMASLKQAADSWWLLWCRPHRCQHVNTNHSIWTSL